MEIIKNNIIPVISLVAILVNLYFTIYKHIKEKQKEKIEKEEIIKKEKHRRKIKEEINSIFQEYNNSSICKKYAIETSGSFVSSDFEKRVKILCSEGNKEYSYHQINSFEINDDSCFINNEKILYETVKEINVFWHLMNFSSYDSKNRFTRLNIKDFLANKGNWETEKSKVKFGYIKDPKDRKYNEDPLHKIKEDIKCVNDEDIKIEIMKNFKKFVVDNKL